MCRRQLIFVFAAPDLGEQLLITIIDLVFVTRHPSSCKTGSGHRTPKGEIDAMAAEVDDPHIARNCAETRDAGWRSSGTCSFTTARHAFMASNHARESVGHAVALA